MAMQNHVSLRLFALACACAAGFAICGTAEAVPVPGSQSLRKAVPNVIVTVQDWRADRGRTWRDDLTTRAPVPQSAPPPAVRNFVPDTTLGYGPRGYSYSGPAYDRYVTGNNPSYNTGTPGATPGADTGLSSCPPPLETGTPSGATYFGSDGKRRPCP
jgi:hypothetical protein